MKRKRLVALWAVLVVVSSGTLVQAQTDKPNIFNIKTYGAVGDGVTLNTEALQKTIDACHAAGGGTVRVPTGEFVIGTIRLKSHVTLSLDYGASLLGSLDWGLHLVDCKQIQFNAVTIRFLNQGRPDHDLGDPRPPCRRYLIRKC